MAIKQAFQLMHVDNRYAADLWMNTLAIFEQSDFLTLVIIDMEGKNKFVSRSYAAKFGRDQESFIGRSGFELMHPDDVPRVLEVSVKCMKDPAQSYSVDVRKATPGGAWITSHWQFKAMIHDGQPVGILCLGHDITGFIGQLESTDVLFQEIAFMQSHIIRQPLANILGIIGIFETEQLDERHKMLFSNLVACVNQADQLVREIVSASSKTR